MNLRALAALLSLAFLGGCAPARLDPTAPPEQQVQFTLTALAKVLKSRDMQEILPFFTEDVTIVEGREKPAQGLEPLKRHLQGTQFLIERTRLTPIATYAEQEGVRQTGTLTHTYMLPHDRRASASMRFEAFWVKGQDGRWRIRRWEVVPLK